MEILYPYIGKTEGSMQKYTFTWTNKQNLKNTTLHGLLALPKTTREAAHTVSQRGRGAQNSEGRNFRKVLED